MRSMYGPGQLLSASKKPRLLSLIEQSKNLSVDEIKRLNEKSWIIQGLLEIKELGTEKLTKAELIANKMQTKHAQSWETFSNAIYQYNGEPRWIKTGRSELLVETGWYWAYLYADKIYVSSNIVNLHPNLINEMKLQSQYIKMGSISSLKELERDRVFKLI
jgi:hypothetical protein